MNKLSQLFKKKGKIKNSYNTNAKAIVKSCLIINQQLSCASFQIASISHLEIKNKNPHIEGQSKQPENFETCLEQDLT